ncbi:MAG: DUF159 family protein [Gemmatimonadota bacterium]|nr:MAG: DUF159 family protein [Gemmatimonadota bacterium]
MCGRYSLTTERHDLARELGLPLDAIPEDYAPRWNVAPSQSVAALRDRDQGIRFDWLQWGLLPDWVSDPSGARRPINARSESLAQKPSFRDSFRRRRCLIVADGFYEWAPTPGRRTAKTPYFIHLKSNEPFTFAGLWSRWRGKTGDELHTCAIVTGEPNELVAGVHDRMPVIVPRERREAWLDPEHQDPTTLAHLLQPLAADLMTLHPVSTHVNAPRNDDPECVAPLPESGPPDDDRPLTLFD